MSGGSTSYFYRLTGTPIAAALTCLGFVAGADGDQWALRGLIGAASMSLWWWILVLWKAGG